MTLDLNKLREEHAKLNSQGGGGDNENKYIILKEGNNVIRILPGKDGEPFYEKTAIHRVKNDEGSPRNFHCRKIHNEECPVCDAYFELWKKHNQAFGGDKELAKKSDSEFSKAARSIKPGQRFYMNVIDRADEGKVKILSVGVMVFNKILGDVLDDDWGPDLINLENGYDFKIVKEQIPGQDWPSYSKSGTRPKKIPAGTEKEIAAFLEQAHDIASLVKLESLEDAVKVANVYCPKESPLPEREEVKTPGEDEFLNKLQS